MTKHSENVGTSYTHAYLLTYSLIIGYGETTNLPVHKRGSGVDV